MSRWGKWVKSARSGQRSDLGDYSFRSGWEANIARLLNHFVHRGWIKSWGYERRVFHFPAKQFKNGRSQRRPGYLPDFEVITNDNQRVYYEIKGFMDSGAKLKAARMLEFYPDEMVLMIDEKEYHQLEKDWARFVPNWEGRRSEVEL